MLRKWADTVVNGINGMLNEAHTLYDQRSRPVVPEQAATNPGPKRAVAALQLHLRERAALGREVQLQGSEVIAPVREVYSNKVQGKVQHWLNELDEMLGELMHEVDELSQDMHGLGAKWYGQSRKALTRIQTPRSNSQSNPPLHPPPTSAAASVDEMKRKEQAIDRNLTVSMAAMGLATGGALIYPPLSLVSVPLTLYSGIDIFQAAYHGLAKERRLRATVLDAVAVVAALVTHYYLASALASSLYYFGQKLLFKTEDRSRKNLVSILGEQPRFIRLLREGMEVQVPFEALRLDDVVVVNAGEMVPIDGRITAGLALIDQQILTGEAQPAEKGVGDRVFSATLVLTGRVCIQTEKTGAATVAAQIQAILNRTADFKSSVITKGQEIADRSVLPTLGAGALALMVRGPIGGVATLSANFSEVLRIAAPLGMLNFLNLASQSGILIKDGRALELLNQVDTIVFDKTGILTLEQPHVGQIYTLNSTSENELLTLAAAAETKQTHPIARAILQAANERELPLPTIDEAQYKVGYGIKVAVADSMIRLGSERFMTQEGIAVPSNIKTFQQDGHAQGYSFVYVAVDDQLGGVIELRPTIRPEVRRIIRALKERKLALYIVSGDYEQPTQKLAAELGIDRYFAGVLPEDKAALVEQLQREGRSVCFVGDGINDAIALKKANASISLRGATTLATDTAQIILMDGTLNQLAHLFALAHHFDANMKASLATTFVPSIVCIGGVFFLHFGIFSTIILYNLSLLASVANAMLPMMQQEKKNNPPNPN
jgi:heavy metal translocating P-type ATPase